MDMEIANREFIEWWHEQKLETEGAFYVAMATWNASRRALLNPQGKGIPEQVAIEILKGEDHLGILVDWLEDNGRLDDIIRARIDELKNLLRRCITGWPSSSEIRKVLREDETYEVDNAEA